MALITLNKLALPNGTVVQTVSSGAASATTINSTSYVQILSLNVTPSDASNKIHIRYDGQYRQDDANSAGSSSKLTRTVGGTETTIFDEMTGRDSADGSVTHTPNFGYLDSPNTTSEVTYKIYAKTSNASSDYRVTTYCILNAFEIQA